MGSLSMHSLVCGTRKTLYLQSNRKKRLGGKTFVPSCWGTCYGDLFCFVFSILLFVLGLH